ncbi:uncharacterized protein EI97DRAFT_390848 [Westerdykella ornata]|uniref:BTB domain-containing protein n=1 Tax=Westerdykella ornata TaxID=318751 RepID=A0A6A6JWF1_WESOR|nr:uncharacterized protein EI97DRAFT_390848 [Westerdykella ornata]KAF2280066.1 hypothetical protein EI97DRAFT_390848 [Westerdykella ornata]
MAQQLSWTYDPHDVATLIVFLPDGTSKRITNLPAGLIRCTCPVLAEALSDGPQGRRQAGIDVRSEDIVHGLMRYLQWGDYLTPAERDQASPSLLKHAEMSKVAQDFDLPRLRVAARMHFFSNTELACCVPCPPADLCETIRFLYRYPTAGPELLDCLLNYCVSCFAYHDLGANAGFRQVAYEIPEFHRALVQTSFKRGLIDEGASAIMQLPVCENTPLSVEIETRDLQSEHYAHGWYDTEPDRLDSTDTDGDAFGSLRTKRRKTLTQSDFNFALVRRFKKDGAGQGAGVYSDSDLSSAEEGFTLVHRPNVTREFDDHADTSNVSSMSAVGEGGARAAETAYDSADEGDDEGFSEESGPDESDDAASVVDVPQHPAPNTLVFDPDLLAACARLQLECSAPSTPKVISAPIPSTDVDDGNSSSWSLV